MNISDQQRFMIQMVDISDTIMYQQQKSQNEQLALINVSVSHELRNPLNSIKARNLEKFYLYKLIHNCLNDLPNNMNSNIKEIKGILLKLEHGRQVQESSTQLMSLIVQDLLDYAQINANKFRKNISLFSIKEIVEQVIEMQKDKANDQRIELLMEFVNLHEEDEESFDEMDQ